MFVTIPQFLKCSTMVLLSLTATLAINVRPAKAELLEPSKFQDCEMHVVGVYSPEDSNTDDRIYVKVLPTGKPTVIVMSGYFGAQWNMDIDPAADVRQIIIPGYFEHSIVGHDETIPVEMITYFPDHDKSNKDFFWAYSLNTQRGREMQARLKELTGLPITTFQGKYSARRFVIDANTVDGMERQESGPATLKLASENLESDPQSIESLVREAFELETQAQQARIAKAEADLQMIKKQFEYRQKMADLIIAKRIEDLSKTRIELEEEIEQIKSDASADILSAEGWKLWREQDWAAALRKFQQAVKLEPKDANIWNGLGWSYLHIGSYDKASEAFQNTLEIEPNHGGAMNGIGQSLMALGRLQEAEAKLTEATESTIKEMGEATAVKRGVTASWFGLVRALLMQDKNDAAKQWAERYLQHKPDDTMMQDLLEEIPSNRATSQ
ncbi:lipoprotein NlpI [Planctomycetes bacterium CA13]|uniref:Lipoprotein NlpI n=1 Tax=Novipirellula herctigrandis TaxID=2527986 RepID=A0A5C5Z7A1_9BACT|nr:lipoprotein NlpI [Planctomycetes bacterium CA13]